MKFYATTLFLFVSTLASAQQVPSSFVPMQPCRLFDSRLPTESSPLAAGTTHQIAVRGICGIPEEANAIFVNVHAVGATGEGYVMVWASDLTAPAAASLTFRGNGADSSGTFSRLCAPPLLECSEVDLSIRPEINSTHVILDVVGYTLPLDQ